jgi:hypothetical protein
MKIAHITQEVLNYFATGKPLPLTASHNNIMHIPQTTQQVVNTFAAGSALKLPTGEFFTIQGIQIEAGQLPSTRHLNLTGYKIKLGVHANEDTLETIYVCTTCLA